MALKTDTEGNKRIKTSDIPIYVSAKVRGKIKDTSYLHRFINGEYEKEFITTSKLTTYNKKLALFCKEENENLKLMVFANKEKVTAIEAEKCLQEVALLYGDLAKDLVVIHQRKTEKFAPATVPITVKVAEVNTTILPAMELLTKKFQRLGNTTDVSTFHQVAHECQVFYALITKWITDIH